MFRFIHAADLHLDSPLQGLEAHEGAPAEAIRGATRRALENLVRLAIAEHIRFLVIAGDVYDRDWKDYSTGLFFRRQMVRLRDQGIPVYLIAGNHDAASVISRKLEPPGNVHEFSTRTAETKEVAGLPVVIHGRGFPNRAVPENLARDYPSAVPERFNLGLLHTSLTGRPGHDAYAPCSEQDLRDKGYRYWALGHVHQPEIVSQDPYVVFAGNSQGRHVNESGPRGCWLVTVNDALAVESVDWHALDVVRWAELKIDLAGAVTESDALRRVRDKMAEAVAEADGRLLAARIVLGGSTSLHGSLYREAERWRAEILAAAQDYGDQAIWIERVQLATRPLYDVAELAQRDALTRIVVETLDQAPGQLEKLPPEIEELLALLPSEVRQCLEQEWTVDQRNAVLKDVRAIILDALGAKAGQGS
jgi:UDP-2,3-diacylglucosamine pyrophosphatase LpxH